MTAPPVGVLAPIYSAIAAVPAITDSLGTFNSVPSIHTRRPVPESAGYPMIVIGPLVTRGDDDGINDFRPLLVVDVTVYGEQPAHYRDVEADAEAIYGLFHRQRGSITVTGYSVTDIRCTGPTPGPTDDDATVARRVTLTIRLAAN